jgi:hypothetical protein
MSDFGVVMIILITGLLTVAMGLGIGHAIGYRQGQISALTGTVQYCLEKQEDLELVWIYREEGCER